VHKHIQQASQHSCGTVDAQVGRLAEEVRHQGSLRYRTLQLVDDATQQHRLSLARIAFHPEQSAVLVPMPLFERGVVKDPSVRAYQQSTFGVLDALLVVARICLAYVLDTPVLFVNLI